MFARDAHWQTRENGRAATDGRLAAAIHRESLPVSTEVAGLLLTGLLARTVTGREGLVRRDGDRSRPVGSPWSSAHRRR